MTPYYHFRNLQGETVKNIGSACDGFDGSRGNLLIRTGGQQQPLIHDEVTKQFLFRKGIKVKKF